MVLLGRADDQQRENSHILAGPLPSYCCIMMLVTMSW
jgi:hypothetical protein